MLEGGNFFARSRRVIELLHGLSTAKKKTADPSVWGGTTESTAPIPLDLANGDGRRSAWGTVGLESGNRWGVGVDGESGPRSGEERGPGGVDCFPHPKATSLQALRSDKLPRSQGVA